jgi:hypothetical protein
MSIRFVCVVYRYVTRNVCIDQEYILLSYNNQKAQSHYYTHRAHTNQPLEEKKEFKKIHED